MHPHRSVQPIPGAVHFVRRCVRHATLRRSPLLRWPPSQAPSAEPRDIKRAYHALMREVHPDRAPPGLQEQMAALCVLLNEIYEVGHMGHRGYSREAGSGGRDVQCTQAQVQHTAHACLGRVERGLWGLLEPVWAACKQEEADLCACVRSVIAQHGPSCSQL